MKTRDQRKRSTGNGAGATAIAERGSHREIGKLLHDYGTGIKTHLHGQVPSLKGLTVLVSVDKDAPSVKVTCATAGTSALDEMCGAIEKHVNTHAFRNGRAYTANVRREDKGALILFR